jgi:hypothetical protein
VVAGGGDVGEGVGEGAIEIEHDSLWGHEGGSLRRRGGDAKRRVLRAGEFRFILSMTSLGAIYACTQFGSVDGRGNKEIDWRRLGEDSLGAVYPHGAA